MGKSKNQPTQNNDRFVFENLEVYQIAAQLYSDILCIKLTRDASDRAISGQLHRAGLSISLNIAEGAGKTGPRDKRRFLVIARGSLYECVAIFNVLKIKGTLNEDDHRIFYTKSIRISKMLRSMINNLDKK